MRGSTLLAVAAAAMLGSVGASVACTGGAISGATPIKLINGASTSLGEVLGGANASIISNVASF